ncbi:hypothetical protein HC766_06650 [Candidatus Gracilibacteria bacterium]|nr:hypothetical protein [Candidatus Gracilibacteria bacterium]
MVLLIHYESLRIFAKLQQLQEEDLVGIKGVGQVLALNYTEFLSSPRFLKILKGFKQLEKNHQGLKIQEKAIIKTYEQTLSNQIICITGSFDIPRSQIKEMLEAKGAKVTSSITSATTILLAGEKAGSKLQKAQELGTVIQSDYKKLILSDIKQS